MGRTVFFLLVCLGLVLASDVKYSGGLLARLDPEGASIRAGDTFIDLAKLLPGFRRLVARDFAIHKRRLAVSATASLGLGKSANILALFDLDHLDRPAEILTTGDVICDTIGFGSSGLWCLGPDFRKAVADQPFSVLWRLDGAGGFNPVLPREFFNKAWAPPWRAGLLGEPSISTAGGAIWLWTPNSGQITRIDESTLQTESFGTGPILEGRSRISFAASSSLLLALMPIGSGGEERLTTPYSLFALDTSLKRWIRVTDAQFPRGTQLLAIDSPHAILWRRTGKGSLLRIPIAAAVAETGTPPQ